MDGRGEPGEGGDIGVARPLAGRPGIGDVDQGPQVAQLWLRILLLELLLVGIHLHGGLLVGHEEGGQLGDVADVAHRLVLELQRDVVVVGKASSLFS